MRKEQIFTGITSQGGLLPADFLAALSDPKSGIDGLDPLSYRLAPGERLGEQVNRSWNRLKGCWANFQRALVVKEPGDPTTTETRERWLLPLFQELDFGRLSTAKPLELDGRTYAVSHGWGPVPIHLVGSHVDLDRRTPGAVGAAKANPHSLVQQVLNASDDHLWGIISNGFILRLLRDNLALTRQAYVEWDLQAIFDGDLYPEFFLLWVACHQSRFEVPPGGRPEQCWLEKWRKQAEDTGLRALENLRPGVEQAIAVLGTGLISHKSNQALRGKLSTGQLSTQDFYRQILRLIYRLLFLLVAEDRSLLHPPLPSEEDGKDALEKAIQARRRYDEFYSISRLRFLTRRRAGTPHPDLWQIFQFVTVKLGSDAGCPELALPALGSFLWSAESTPDLNQCLVSNRNFLEAVHSLAYIRDGDVRRIIDYKNLGSEELGSVYESLLELHPYVNAEIGTFELQTAAGHERKTSGSYYTPDSLVQCLLDSALEPVMDEAVKGKEGSAAAEALLKLKICDPAVGSGHFLIAAAHRLAKRIAAARTGEEEPSPEATRTALRDVIGRCLYGVDINPMAAELCRVNLWVEALEPGKPLSFLDHHIRIGNSLLGTTPVLIAGGLPDEASTPIEGDDRKACSVLKKRNKAEKKSSGPLLAQQDAEIQARLQMAASALEDLPDVSPKDIHTKELLFRRHEQNEEFQKKKKLADAWCAAFFIEKHFLNPSHESNAVGITQGHLNDMAAERPLSADLSTAIERLSHQYQFFHWHLAFPEIMAKGGFDCILGNPPWGKFTIQDEEWFAARDPRIADTKGKTHRDRLIRDLIETNPELYDEYKSAKRDADLYPVFCDRSVGIFPLTGFKELNTYHLFAELGDRLISKSGRVGIIVKTGIGSAENCLPLFKKWTEGRQLVALLDFVNSKPLFPAVQTVERFSLLTYTGSQGHQDPISLATLCKDVPNLQQPGRVYSLTPEDIALMSPLNGACPLLKGERDAEIMRKVYTHFPILGNWDQSQPETYWNPEYVRIFDMANDSGEFKKYEDLLAMGLHRGPLNRFIGDYEEYWPLYEGKYIFLLDHRYGTFETVPASKRFGRKAEAPSPLPDQLADPNYEILPRYWFPKSLWLKRAAQKSLRTDFQCLFRDVAGVYPDLRTAICAIVPAGPAGDKAPYFTPLPLGNNPIDAHRCLAFFALFGSLPFDYIVRNKLYSKSLKLNVISQIPMPPPSQALLKTGEQFNLHTLLIECALELTCTTWSLKPLFNVLGIPAPFRYDPNRRYLLHREIDAIAAHLYKLSREDFAHVLATFETLQKYETATYGEYKTARIDLDNYNAMATAICDGNPYKTHLDPPPADPGCCHPLKEGNQ